ncbi:BTAD domain-containing putative transcriptional regulator [Streptomyces sp. H10-C2]|uniref:BTAD domain-containing putative transcriptional regulator n=1 Tax=unclassified Streptomyces TaxID=2593676 RepID=UPI0024B8F6DE|nr:MULTISPECIES: BTAD domain-containing putative transcriptional regulator [unclassified Streptomyces]MDJ0342477.1 BTAD domain-containing putative transcriptional regulator [Streptomyces sp. PH10-H1]MDJ0372332.1 BTAD domain-containing putative transcriptional regulator [Streptomyces sp. H10-C2]
MARTSASRRPAQPARPQPPRRRRTFGDFVRALVAFLALSVLLAGVPGALLYFIGSPLPHDWNMAVLREPITADTFISVLAVVVWLAWAQFTACVLVETKAAISGIGMPSRVPASGPSQLLARQLIAALLLIGASAASLTPGLAQLGNLHDQPHRGGPAVTARQTPGQVQQHQQAAAAAQQHQGGGPAATTVTPGAVAAAEAGDKATKFYRIQPPEGRHHDSLWEIAERHLGDGRRYNEVYQLNKDRAQPDGSKLSKASLIRPGWIMEMPADARGGDLVEMPVAAPKTAPDVKHYAERGGSKDTTAEGAHAAHAAPAAPAQTPAQAPTQTPAQTPAQQPAQQPAHAESVPAAPSGPAAAAVTAGPQSESHGFGHGFGLPEALIGAPLLAAGLLAALGRRRRTVLWQSVTAGALRTPRTPTGPEADAADALRIGADADTVTFLDRALRALSARLASDGTQLPTVYAAWLTDEALHLQLAWPEGQPPAPWQLGQDQTFWRLDRSDLLPDADVSASAPYPGLAALGTLDGARLMLNLEAVPGIVSLTGARADREAVLASVASELATNGWSDRMTVTLVGFAEDLTALAPARIRHLADVPEVIETMSAETAQRSGALRTAGQDSVLTGRTGNSQHTQRAPHLVLIAVEPTEEEADRLAELAAGSGRLGIGYLVASGRADLPGAAWELEVTPAGRLLAPLLGLDLEAQLLPAAQYEAILRLFAAADPDREPSAVLPPFMVDLTDQGRPGVYARLLGPFELIGLETPEAGRSLLLHEALALLLLHREGVHPRVLASALWPRGVTDDVRDALIGRLRDWLGTDPGGSSRLSSDATGRLVLSRTVVSDWDVLQTLHHAASEGPGANDPQTRRRLLTDALALARGSLLEDRTPGRYGWLAHEIVDAQHPVLVAEVALALSGLHLDAGKPKAAVAAVQAALAVTGSDERLWLALLRATQATGDPARLEAAAESLLVRNQALNGSPRGLPPRVEALLDELLPTWRGSIAN